MVFASLLMGLAALASASRAISAGEDGSFVVLFETALVGDPAEEVLYVFADLGGDTDELHVLSHRKTLGVFGLEEDRAVEQDLVVAVPSPRVQLPPTLEPGESWVFSESSIGTAAFDQGRTTYHPFSPPGPDVPREGSWSVLASGDGGTLFFVRGGTQIEHPGEYTVMDGTEHRVTRPTRMLPRIQSSRDGREFLVQAEKNVFHSLDGPIDLPRGGTLYLQPAAHWVVHEFHDRIELRDLAGRVSPVQPTLAPPLMAVGFEPNHVLLVARTRAELFDLRSLRPGEPAAALYGIQATEGHRFSSAALFPRGDGVPWVALGELAVRVPQLLVPNAPEPVASAVVRAVDPAGRVAETWSVEIHDWRGSTPLVQWSKEGRLLASTKDRVLASPSPLP